MEIRLYAAIEFVIAEVFVADATPLRYAVLDDADAKTAAMWFHVPVVAAVVAVVAVNCCA
jgi:hypothetical protein